MTIRPGSCEDRALQELHRTVEDLRCMAASLPRASILRDYLIKVAKALQQMVSEQATALEIMALNAAWKEAPWCNELAEIPGRLAQGWDEEAIMKRLSDLADAVATADER